jgi:2-dehydro-3-deoxy-D-gluconate 5-dehydrogenase
VTSFDLVGKKAIVAGGAGDLGRGIVTSLAHAGVSVAVIDVAQDLDAWATSLRSVGESPVHGVRADLSDRLDLRRGFDDALRILGDLDILVNAQGIQRRYPAEEFPLEVWDEVIELNLTSVFALCQLAGRVMLARGYGKIINIASMQSFTGGFTIPAYAASKAGVAQITKAFANEWTGRGITVNAIAPGYMDTKMTAAVKADPVRYERILARIPAGRWGQPADLCGPLLFLAAPASDYVSGVILPVDGGMLGT